MAVKIRMKMTGTTNKPSFRIVVTDIRFQRDGRFIENIGFYDPRHNVEKVDVERADYWMSQGAKPSETVMDILNRAKGIKVEKKRIVRKSKAELKKEAEAAGA